MRPLSPSPNFPYLFIGPSDVRIIFIGPETCSCLFSLILEVFSSSFPLAHEVLAVVFIGPSGVEHVRITPKRSYIFIGPSDVCVIFIGR